MTDEVEVVQGELVVEGVGQELVVTSPKIEAPGVYDLTMEQYHGQCCVGPSMSSSTAKIITKRTLAHAKADADSEDDDHTRRGSIGTGIHALLLEPLRARKLIRVLDHKTFQSNAAKADRDKVLKEGLMPILRPDYEACVEAVDVVMQFPDAVKLIRGANAEQSLIALDPQTGLYLKARPDLLNTSGRHVIMGEVKSVTNCDDEELRRHAYNNQWHEQCTWHADVYERVMGEPVGDYQYLCVEIKKPHAVKVWQPGPNALALGSRKNTMARLAYARAVATGAWPAYAPGVRVLDLPDYALYRENIEEEQSDAEARAAIQGSEYNAISLAEATGADFAG